MLKSPFNEVKAETSDETLSMFCALLKSMLPVLLYSVKNFESTEPAILPLEKSVEFISFDEEPQDVSINAESRTANTALNFIIPRLFSAKVAKSPLLCKFFEKRKVYVPVFFSLDERLMAAEIILRGMF